jgi:hypothetical protein
MMNPTRAALASIVLAAAALPLPFIARAASATSHNWSGYAVAGAARAVAGDWTVPEATGAAGAGDAAWVGIGGLTSTDLIQAGTRAELGAGGAARYVAWYELLPSAATPIAMTVAPGDRMHAAITERAPGRWEIELDDLTTGERFSIALAYDSSESSAEWIVEAPRQGGGNVPLDDFSAVSFSNARAASDGGAKTPAALGATRVSLVDRSGAPLAVPGTLSGGSFTIVRQ